MKVVVTGGAGFLGQLLIRALCERGTLICNDSRNDSGNDSGKDGRSEGASARITRILAIDQAQSGKLFVDERVEYAMGDISGKGFLAHALSRDTDSVFHLAAVVSGGAEADFDLGMRVNVDATRALLDACREQHGRPRLVFASSVAVFGSPLPDTVTDATTPTPKSSYGIQKLIGELLVADYSRKGYIDGRAVRVPTVVVRPGKPNARGLEFRQRHHPRAARRRGIRLPGRARHRAVDHVAARGRGGIHPRPRDAGERLGTAALAEPSRADDQRARDDRGTAHGRRRRRSGAREDGARRAHPRDRRHLAGALHDRACRQAGIQGGTGHGRHRAGLRRGVRTMTTKKAELEKRAGLKIVGALRQGAGADRYGRDSAVANERRARRERDRAAGLVPFAVKLPAATVQALQGRAQNDGRELGELVDDLLRQALAAPQTGNTK